MTNTANTPKEIENYVKNIKSSQDKIDELQQKLEAIIQRIEIGENKYDIEYWKLFICYNFLGKLKNIVTTNFSLIESFGVLITTRYLFEMHVWLRLIKEDEDHIFCFIEDHIQSQLKFYKSLLKRTRKEIEILIEIDETDETDEYAARKFLIYFEQAKFNGYGYQAHLVEKKVIPKYEGYIQDIEKEQKSFKGEYFTSAHETKCRGINTWKNKAIKAGLGEDYDFIYDYSSLLLHARPNSVITRQKNLEEPEILMFIKYFYVSLLDILDIISEFAEKRISS